jgi:hypothetical protein
VAGRFALPATFAFYTEFWTDPRHSESYSFEQLGPDGKYVPVPRSRFLLVHAEDITRWVFSEDSADLVTWEERLREWIRNELVPGVNA